MKLLQILYPGLGGHSSVAFSLIEGDENRVLEHHLLGYGIENPSQTFLSKANELKVEYDSVLKPKGLEIKSLIEVYRHIKRIKPDYIISHSTAVIFVIFIYSLFHKINWTMVEHQSNHAKSKKDWVYTFFILLLSPQIVYLTESYKKEILGRFKGWVNQKKIRIIPNGINLKKYYPASERLANEVLTFSMISRLNSLRDHKTLICAIGEVSKTKPCKLYIAGDGETKDELINLVNELELEEIVEFTGLLNEDEIVSLLHKTDIYIHSSLAETQSTSLMQVMACKIPIIATDIEGIREMLTSGKDALLFKPKNVNDLLSGIFRLINDEKLKREIVIHSFIKIKNKYCNNQQFNSYIKHLNQSDGEKIVCA